MLSAALRRNVCNRALNYFKKRLLNAFAADVARYRSVFGLSCDFIYFVDINNAALGSCNIKIRRLNKP